MKKRQISTIWITGMLIAAVFFLNAVTNSDKGINFSLVVPIFMSLPFLVIGIYMVYVFRDKKK